MTDDARATEVGRLVLRLCELLGIGAPSTPLIYSDVQLPPDVASRQAFLALHRAKVLAGVPGWNKQGSIRSVTATAWAEHVEQDTAAARRRKMKNIPPKRGVGTDIEALSDAIDRDLGIRTKSPRRCRVR